MEQPTPHAASGSSRSGVDQPVALSDREVLATIFRPRSVAVIGATERAGSVGRTLMTNLLSGGFAGAVHAVNPNQLTVFGAACHPAIGDVPEPVDLAVIVTPAPTVPAIVGQCVDAGVGGVIVISAGFRETGDAGRELEQEVLQHLQRGRTRLVGPNCLGVAVPGTGLNATFAHQAPRPGRTALLSQSGALCTAILDWSIRENIGFSAMVSVGGMLDVDWGDLIDYFGDDPGTKAIAIYMESIVDARSFLSAARVVAMDKPIIVIKAGRTAAAGKAAASHTGSLAGSDEAIDAAFRRAGVLRVDSIADLFDMVEALDQQRLPAGPGLAIVTNAGGPGVLATDALITNGGKLVSLSAPTLHALDQVLPPHWSHGNPIDVLGDAPPERFAAAVAAAAGDPSTDAVLAVLTPQSMTDPVRTAEQVAAVAGKVTKPVLACWMGGEAVQSGRDVLRRAKLPSFQFPDTAARAFQYLCAYRSNLESLYETPVLPDGPGIYPTEQATQVIDAARSAGRELLTEVESKQLLAAYGIPCTPMRLTTTKADAIAAADAIGYPVVLKLHSETVTHKSDVGGVRLNLPDASAVADAFAAIRAGVIAHAGEAAFGGVTVQPMVRHDGYEVILGSTTDVQLGPVVLFGLGGTLVEVFADRALALPPLTATLARRMMERTKIYKALQGVRGRPAVDLAALERLLVRFSQLVVEQKWVREIDINPLIVSHAGAMALDARVVLHSDEQQIVQPAIRPYPTQYVWQWQTRDGIEVTIRPIRPEDEPQMVQFHQELSETSVFNRYGGTMKLSRRTSHRRLIRVCFADYDRELPLVVEHVDPASGLRQIVAVGRLNRLRGQQLDAAEFALLVADRWQGKGIGGRLMELLVGVGRAEGLRQIVGTILPGNFGMLRVCKRAGMTVNAAADGGGWIAGIDL